MDKKPHYHGHRERLRSKLRKDPTHLADYEILELLLAQVLLRKDTKPLAKELLAKFHSLSGVFNAPATELRTVEGFGPSLENYWLLLKEFMSRYLESPVRERTQLHNVESVAEMARVRLGSNAHEEFWAAFLDNQNRMLAWEKISTGTVNSAMIYPRDLMEQSLHFKASKIILVHNHPGGSVSPSQQDVDVTKQIDRSARSLGITVLDHIIVTEDSYCSLKEHGAF